MERTAKIIIAFGIFVLYLVAHLHIASALIVDADYITVFPGEEGSVDIEVENNGDEDLEDVSVSLILGDVPFSSVGSATKVEDIDEDDEENFEFRIRANSNIVPGDYSIPYEISYKEDSDSNTTIQRGSFGIRVSAETDLDYSVDAENNVVGRQGQIDLEIINRGLGEIKAVSVSVEGSGIKILSANKIFVGNIDAEDSDVVSYDVVFNSRNPTVNARIEYKDFDNNNQVETISLPVQVYSEEEALELGIIQQNGYGLWISVVVLLVILFILWRVLRKKKKKKNRE